MPSPCDQTITRVDAMRRLAIRLEAGDLGDDGVWLGQSLARYLSEAHRGVALGEAFGVEPGSWWLLDSRQRRDDALREYARQFLQSASSMRARASVLASALRRYESGPWLRDRRAGRLPVGLDGTPRDYLFRACSSQASGDASRDMPNSVKQIERILSN